MLLTVDTLSFALCGICENDLFNLLGLNKDLFTYSYSSHQQNYDYGYYAQGMTISFSESGKWTSYVHMSGKGCRFFEDQLGVGFSWYSFIRSLSYAQVSFRRIDIAADDTSGVLTFDKVDKCFRLDRVSGKCHKFRCTYGSEECFYAGSPKSNCLIRIYNKALERGYKDGLVNGSPWTRCEMQLRDPYAGQLVFEWLRSQDLQSIFSGHLLEQLRFLTKRNDKSNSQRINTARFWSLFIGNVKKIKFISAPGSDYNLYRTQKYLQNQAASSIRTFSLCTGWDPSYLVSFLSGSRPLNDKQKLLVRQFLGDDWEDPVSFQEIKDERDPLDLVRDQLRSE